MGDERGPQGLSLAGVESQLYDLITAPEGAGPRLQELGREAESLESMVRPTARLSAVERVDIYANMYFYRILDVLREEHPKVAASLGDGAFHNLVTDYLLACRPAHPSLREVGARFPEYLSRHATADARPWLGELARLERAYLELHDGPDAEALTLDHVRAQPPEALPALLLRAIPCHAVLHNRHAISAFWGALDAGGDQAPPAPEASPEALLVWRPELAVRHRLIDDDEAPLIAALRDGARFEILCERLLESIPAEQAAQRAFELLARWIGEGLLARS